MANLAVLSSIPQRGDHILYDELCHASIKDGMRLSNAKYISFKHNDFNDLEIKLGKIDGEKYIVAESIYSMDGDQCPLEKLVDITEKYGAFLILDEAHATGLYGAYGGGISQLKKLEKKIFCRIYTFGKALGYHGAAVAGSKELKNFLINFARPLIYTTALPRGSYAIIKTGFDYIIKHPDLRITSQKITNVFINEFEMRLSNKFKRTNSNHLIQTVLVSGNERVKSLAEKLNQLGYDVRAILSPTVKQGQERLRVCLHNYNTEEEVIGLVKSLEEL